MGKVKEPRYTIKVTTTVDTRSLVSRRGLFSKTTTYFYDYSSSMEHYPKRPKTVKNPGTKNNGFNIGRNKELISGKRNSWPVPKRNKRGRQ